MGLGSKHLKLKLTRGDKERHFVLVKGTTVNQENITVINIYVSSSCAPNFIKMYYWL